MSKHARATHSATSLTPQKAFGKVMRDRREELGLTQSDLEDDVIGDRAYISRLETGIRQPCLNLILHLARKLGMTPGELMDAVERRLQDTSSDI